MYIKKVTYITVKIGAFISWSYTASHLFSLRIIILICMNKKKFDIITIGVGSYCKCIVVNFDIAGWSSICWYISLLLI